MDQQNKKIDYSKLDPELKAKILEWEKNTPAYKQLEALKQVVDRLDSVAQLIKDDQKQEDQSSNEAKALLKDIKLAISSLSDKEGPESSDISQPIVDALSKLETALTDSVKAVSVQPEFKPTIKVDSPTVNVDAPKIDLSGVEKVLRSDIPKAFEQAIQAIPEAPETDLSPMTDLLQEMSVQLASIDTATRLKPQAPETIKVTNPDGSSIGGAPTLTERYDTSNSPILYTGTAAVGTSDASTGWTITKYDLTLSSAMSGKIATDVSWNNRASGTYA